MSNEVERFEPYGANLPNSINYSPLLLDNELQKIFFSYNIKVKYLVPKDYLPDIYLQYFEINEYDDEYLGDPDGYCSAWCIFWIELRLKYIYISRYKLIITLKKEILNNNYKYKKIIRNYIKNITDLRDNILKKSNTDINKWNNDNISDKQLNLLIENIHSFIHNLKLNE